MMQVLPMPCCGAEPFALDEHGRYAYNEKGGWDPETKLCRNCGASQKDYHCESSACDAVIEKGKRFCPGCAAAYQMGRTSAQDTLRAVQGELLEHAEDRDCAGPFGTARQGACRECRWALELGKLLPGDPSRNPGSES